MGVPFYTCFANKTNGIHDNSLFNMQLAGFLNPASGVVITGKEAG